MRLGFKRTVSCCFRNKRMRLKTRAYGTLETDTIPFFGFYIHGLLCIAFYHYSYYHSHCYSESALDKKYYTPPSRLIVTEV